MAWNRPTEERGKREKGKGGQRNVHLKGLFAAAIVVLGAAVAWLFFSDNGGAVSSPLQKKPARSAIREVKPAPAPKAEPKEKHPQKKARRMDEASLRNVAAKEEFLKRARQNPETWFLMTNKIAETENKGYRTSVEQVMDWIFNTEPGDEPPLPPCMLPEHEMKNLAAILISKGDFRKDDDETATFRRETVQLAKKEYAKFIRDGGDPAEFLPYYHKELQIAYDRRQDAAQIVLTACKEEDPAIARELYEKVNDHLKKDGIKPVELPGRMRRRLGINEETQGSSEE